MNPRIHITRHNTLTGESSPVDIITPQFIGQEYITKDKRVFKAIGLTKTDWINLRESSDYATKAEVNVIKEDLSISENTKYSTTNGIKEFECKDGYIDNISIEGKTLVNLTLKQSPIWEGSGVNASDGNRILIADMHHNLVSPNTPYTFFNCSDKDILILGLINHSTWSDAYTIPSNSSMFIQFNEGNYLGAIIGYERDGWTSNDLDIFSKACVILEGDYTNKPITYFEGLKSVGQGDSIDVLSHNKTNKNLIEDTFTYTKDMVINYSNGELKSVTGHYACNNYIKIEPSTDYMFVGINGNRAYYDKNKQVVPPVNNSYLQSLLDKTNGSKKNFMIEKSPSNARYVRITIHKDNLIDGKAYLYKNSNYSHKRISTTLRSLPNGVRDTIEKIGNKYVKVQRCGEYIINEKSKLREWSSQVGETTKLYGLDKTYNVISDAKPLSTNRVNTIVCNQYKSLNSVWDGIDTNIGAVIDQNKVFSFRDLSSKFPTLDSVYTYLSTNPITVVYELETPIITELPNFNPQTYEGDTTLLLNSGVIQAECSFEVTNSMGSELDVLKDKVSDLDSIVEEVPSLQNKVDKGQNHKLTQDPGWSHLLTEGTDLNTCTKTGFYTINSPLNMPASESDWVELEVIVGADYRNVQQRLLMQNNSNMYYRWMRSGIWGEWIKFTSQSEFKPLKTRFENAQVVKMTEDNGACRGIPNNNANDINITGFWMGTNVTNTPTVTHGWIYIESLVHNDLYQVQTAIDLHDSTRRWTRHKLSGTWNDWRSL